MVEADLVQLDAANETEPADLLHVGIVLERFSQATPEPLALCGHRIEEGWLCDDVEDGLGCMTDERIASKGRAVVARLHGICDVLLHKERTDRQPTCMQDCCCSSAQNKLSCKHRQCLQGLGLQSMMHPDDCIAVPT